MSRYIYEDAGGVEQFSVVRARGKRFSQQHKDDNGRWVAGRNGTKSVLYRLPELRKQIHAGGSVWILEGEKDVETARDLGLVATCNPGGAGKWQDEYSQWLVGASKVFIVWDKDTAGRTHALKIADSLRQAGVRKVYFRCARRGKDFTDHIKSGFDVSDLKRVKPAAPPERRVEPSENGGQALPAGYRLLREHLLSGIKQEGDKPYQFNALCPTHPDRQASLSVDLSDDGRVLMYCQTGSEQCSFDNICEKLGLNQSDLSGKRVTNHERDVENEVKKKWVRHDADLRYSDELFRDAIDSCGEYKEDVAEVLIRYQRHVEGEEPEVLDEESLMKLSPPRPAIDCWVPDGPLTIHGPPGGGKSIVLLDWADAFRRGSSWYGYRVRMPGNVLFLTGEGFSPNNVRLEATLRMRGQVNGAYRIYFIEESWDLTDPFGLMRLVQLVQKYEAHMVIIDPYGEYAPSGGDIENTEPYARAMLALSKGLNIFVVTAQHEDAQETRARGTDHLRMYGLGHIRLHKLSSTEFALEAEKMRNSRLHAARFRIEPVADGIAIDMTQGSADDPWYPEDLKREIVERREQAKQNKKTAQALDPELLDLVYDSADKGCTQAHVLTATRGSGYGTEVVKQALSHLVNSGRIDLDDSGKRHKYTHSNGS